MIGVVGATGFTGRLVARRLQELSAEFCILGRSLPKLEHLSGELAGVAAKQINALDPSTLVALEGCDVIINCAGPFTQLGEPVVREAITRGIHYLDTTGEQAFIKRVYDKFGAAAQDQKIVLVPACAFEYAIGDTAGALIVEELPDCNEVEIVYVMENMHASSGTKKSVIHAIESQGLQLSGGSLVERPPAAICRQVTIDGSRRNAFSFPGGEVLMLPRHTSVRNVSTLMAADLPAVLVRGIATAGQSLVRGGLSKVLTRLVDAFSREPAVSERLSTSFNIICSGKSSSGVKQLTISGTDPYWLTALIVAGCADYLDKHQPSQFGALTPSMVAGPQLIQEVTESAGTVWRR